MNPSHEAVLSTPVAARVYFTDGVFAGPGRLSIRFEDRWQIEEWALFGGDGRRAEVYYARAKPGKQVALEHGLTVERAVETWRYNAGRESTWGPLGRVPSGIGVLFYRSYRIAGANRACAGFIGEWDLKSDDPLKRYGRLLFGYFCAREGEALDTRAIERSIHAIRIKSESEAPAPMTSMALAADASNDSAGPLRFPFKFARYYRVGNGKQLQ